MLEAFGNYPEGECLNARHGFVTVLAIAHDARECGDLREPAAIVLKFELDGERQVGTVTFGQLANKAADCQRELW